MSGRNSFKIVAAALLGAAASAMASEPGVLELQAPRLPAAGEAVNLQIRTGPLPRGARLEVLTEQGSALGAVFPFAAPQGSTATMPVPSDALSGGRLRLRLEIIEPGAPPRPPRPGEVERLDLIMGPEGQ